MDFGGYLLLGVTIFNVASADASGRTTIEEPAIFGQLWIGGRGLSIVSQELIGDPIRC